MAKKILVAEDNEMNRILLRDILVYYSYEVIEADNGEQCVKLAKEHIPCLILMDIQMPVMDGFTALRVLRTAPDTMSIPVIAITSFAMDCDRKKIMEAGFDEHISKPIDTRHLPELVKNFMREDS